jgi:hypothetical protein
VWDPLAVAAPPELRRRAHHPSQVYIHQEGQTQSLQVDPQYRHLLAGHLGWQVDPRASDGWQRLVDVWTASGLSSCENEYFPLPESDVFATIPSEFAAYAYDAVAAMAMALHDVGLANGPGWRTRRDVVLNTLLNSSFEGASGTVQFEANGDRSASGLTYTLVNFVWADAVLTSRTVRQSVGIELQIVRDDIIWLGGSTSVPYDAHVPLKERRANDDSQSSAIATSCALLLALILAYTWWFRAKKKAQKRFVLVGSSATPRFALTPEMRWHLFLSEQRSRAGPHLPYHTRTHARTATCPTSFRSVLLSTHTSVRIFCTPTRLRRI